jgi:alpha-D-ribose 1-methylphosphonate 5-triphosphate synthase subunit PhnG
MTGGGTPWAVGWPACAAIFDALPGAGPLPALDHIVIAPPARQEAAGRAPGARPGQVEFFTIVRGEE